MEKKDSFSVYFGVHPDRMNELGRFTLLSILSNDTLSNALNGALDIANCEGEKLMVSFLFGKLLMEMNILPLSLSADVSPIKKLLYEMSKEGLARFN